MCRVSWPRSLLSLPLGFGTSLTHYSVNLVGHLAISFGAASLVINWIGSWIPLEVFFCSISIIFFLFFLFLFLFRAYFWKKIALLNSLTLSVCPSVRPSVRPSLFFRHLSTYDLQILDSKRRLSIYGEYGWVFRSKAQEPWDWAQIRTLSNWGLFLIFHQFLRNNQCFSIDITRL
jgi:hypothetical protein